jgi:hypothetical protein
VSRFELQRVKGQAVETQDIVTDLRRVLNLLNKKIITQYEYESLGKYSATTVKRRFGSWNAAVIQIGAQPSIERDISDDRLYKNIFMLWEYYGRQPRKSELAKPPSSISEGPYFRRFNSWQLALENFVSYANSEGLIFEESEQLASSKNSPRLPSLRLRFKILQRDHFRCVACGNSPSLHPGLILHVDHINPWSKGGLTEEKNLQTLCEPCNLGKSNVL